MSLVEKTPDVSKGIKGTPGGGFVINKAPGSGGFMSKITPELVIKVLLTPPPEGSTLERLFDSIGDIKDRAAPSGGGTNIGKVNKKTGKKLVHGPGGTFEI